MHRKDFAPDVVREFSGPAAILAEWVIALYSIHNPGKTIRSKSQQERSQASLSRVPSVVRSGGLLSNSYGLRSSLRMTEGLAEAAR